MEYLSTATQDSQTFSNAEKNSVEVFFFFFALKVNYSGLIIWG